MSLIRHRGVTFLLYKEIWMQKWAGMLVKSGKAYVDPSAMMTQMREDSDFWSLPPLTILCSQIHLVITRHPKDLGTDTDFLVGNVPRSSRQLDHVKIS